MPPIVPGRIRDDHDPLPLCILKTGQRSARLHDPERESDAGDREDRLIEDVPPPTGFLHGVWSEIRSKVMRMKWFVSSAIVLATISCSRGGAAPAAPQDTDVADMRTIESVDAAPKVVDPPPMLSDEAPPPKPKGMPWEPPQPVILTAEDEKLRAALPFSPAIAMDPVNGDKISIRASTPTLEYKGRIYYFSNDENKRSFAANPDALMKGPYTKL
jgi:YHS domain-containing protein